MNNKHIRNSNNKYHLLLQVTTNIDSENVGDST